MALFTWDQGIWLIFGYAIIMFGIAKVWAGKSSTKDGFLVANRNIGSWTSAFSIASAWIWAPALFVSSQKAYEQGFAGFFWFIAPNVLTLIVFAYFAGKIRDKMPHGYTVSDFMGKRHSKRVQTLYLIQLVGVAVMCLAVQLLAGGKVIAKLTGLPFFAVTIFLAIIALSYSTVFGLRASFVTDKAKMILIYGVGLILVPWVVIEAGGAQSIADGLGGFKGTFGDLFSGDGAGVFWSFGLSSAIGLISGTFGDQAFWQRAFATDKKGVRSAFLKSALLFAIVPIFMSLLGFALAGDGVKVADPSLANVEAVLHYLPAWTVIPFILMLMSGMVSALDSHLTALGSIAGHDILDRMTSDDESKSVSYARASMFITAIAAILIANIPDMQVLYLFLLYGTLRATTMLPTIYTLLSEKVSEKGMFYGIITSFVVGLPIFAYGNFNKLTPWIVAGSLLSLLLSGVIVTVSSKLKK